MLTFLEESSSGVTALELPGREFLLQWEQYFQIGHDQSDPP